MNLFDPDPYTNPSEAELAFNRFHTANSWVYDELVAMTRELQGRGRDTVGIKMLFEVLRWNQARTTTGDDWKINNNYAPWYARKIMLENPDLDGMFRLRAAAADD